MSQANLEIVRRAHEAFTAGGAEATRPFFAPDLLFHSYPEWAGPAEYRGHEGIRAVLAEFTENFDAFEIEVCELREAGDSVVMLGETVGQIRGSSTPIRQPLGTVYSKFRDGRIGEQHNFLTWREALEAAGLSE
jgi:ketosteroid isomerase-like protein